MDNKTGFSLDKILWIVGIFLLAILFIYLPWDLGGLYNRSKAFLSICVFFFLSMRILIPGEDSYPVDLTASAVIFFILIAISTIFSTDINQSIQDSIFLFTGFAGFVMGYSLLKNPTQLKFFLYFMLGNLLLNCITALFAYLMLAGEPGARAYGRFAQADILAGFIIIFLPAAAMMFFSAKKIKDFFLTGFSTVISLFTLYFTKSRGAILASAFVLPAAIYCSFEKRKLYLVIAGTVILILLILVSVISLKSMITHHEVTEKGAIHLIKTVGIKDFESIKARFEFWDAAVRIAISRPLTGTGLGTFQYHYTGYQKNILFYSKYEHNFYLSLASGAGFPALIAFFAVIFFSGKYIIKGLKTLKEQEPVIRMGAIGIALGLLSSLIHVLFDVDFSFSAIFFSFWVIAGTLCKLSKIESVSQLCKTKERLLRMAASIAVAFLMFPPFLQYMSENKIKLGEQMEREKNYAKAEESYRQATNFTPLNSEAARKLSSFYYLMQNYEQALAWIDRAIKLSPYRARLYHFRGKILFDMGRMDQVPLMFEKAIALDPINQVMAYNLLAEFYVSQKKLNEALRVYLKVDAIYKDNDLSRLWHFRSDTLKPQLAATYLGLGNIYLEKQEYQKAIESFNHSIIYFKNFPALFGRGFAYFNLKEWEKSIEDFKTASGIDPNLPQVYFYLFRCYQELGIEKESRQYFQKFQQLQGKTSDKNKILTPPPTED